MSKHGHGHHEDVPEEDVQLKHIWRKLMSLTDLVNTVIANQAKPVTATLDPATAAQISSINSTVTAIQTAVGTGQASGGATPTTTTAAITGINVADTTTTAAVGGAGQFTAGTFTINGVTVSVGASDTLAAIASNTQSALLSSGHTGSTAAITGTAGSFILTVVDPSTSTGTGFAGPAVAGLTLAPLVVS